MDKIKKKTNYGQKSKEPTDSTDENKLVAYKVTKDHDTNINEVNAKPDDFSGDLKSEFDPPEINLKDTDTKPILPKRKGRPPEGKNEQLQVRNPTLIPGPCVRPLCKRDFHILTLEDEKNYRKHVTKHRARRFNCECQIGWPSEKGKQMHIYTAHRGPFHCDTCHETFQFEDSFLEHVAKHAVPSFLEHVAKHAVPKVIVCDACDYKTDSDLKLYGHTKYSHDYTVHVCDLCDRSFKGERKLKLHIKSSHKEKIPCPYCGKIIKSMWKHLKSAHTIDSDKKYQCEQCDKGFIDKYTLEGHMRSVHTRDRPFACRYLCGRASNDRGNRKKHEVTKHGQAFQE